MILTGLFGGFKVTWVSHRCHRECTEENIGIRSGRGAWTGLGPKIASALGDNTGWCFRLVGEPADGFGTGRAGDSPSHCLHILSLTCFRKL